MGRLAAGNHARQEISAWAQHAPPQQLVVCVGERAARLAAQHRGEDVIHELRGANGEAGGSARRAAGGGATQASRQLPGGMARVLQRCSFDGEQSGCQRCAGTATVGRHTRSSSCRSPARPRKASGARAWRCPPWAPARCQTQCLQERGVTALAVYGLRRPTPLLPLKTSCSLHPLAASTPVRCTARDRPHPPPAVHRRMNQRSGSQAVQGGTLSRQVGEGGVGPCTNPPLRSSCSPSTRPMLPAGRKGAHKQRLSAKPCDAG